MSTKTTPEPPAAYHSPFGQEVAPSALREDEPSLARLVGIVGLFAVFGGVLVIVLNKWLGPRALPMAASTWFFVLGVACLLSHAARDADTQIRRTYGAVGGLLVVLAVGLSLIPYEGQVGTLFLPLAAPAYLLGLVFLL